MSDSHSSFSSLKDPSISHPISQCIQITLYTLHLQSTQLTFIWIPGHTDIAEHDLLDSAAKQATNHPKITYPTHLPLPDLKNLYKNHLNFLWNSTWSDQPSNKLYQIKQDIKSWPSSNRHSSREEIVLIRLRIGHICLTYSHLFSSYIFPPLCPFCESDNLKVSHIFACLNLEN